MGWDSRGGSQGGGGLGKFVECVEVCSTVLDDLQVPSNVTLISLPPYSPELNPIDNLWHHLRRHYWSNRIKADYDDLFDVAEQTWLTHCLNRNLIQSICAVPYLQMRN